MKGKKLFALLMAAVLSLGGFPLNGEVWAAENKVIVLKTPQEAAKAINTSSKTNGRLKTSNKKSEHKNAIESRILLRTDEVPQETANAKKVYYYQTGEYYILQYKNPQAADEAEETLVKRYGNEVVVRDRVIMQEEEESDGSGEEQVVPFDGIHAMGMDTLKEEAKDWKGNVEVAVIDSGVDRDHSLLIGRIDTQKSVNLADGADASKYDDTYGHGSHVAGIITQATPDQVKIMAIRVFDDYQMSSLSQITMGIDYARENGADVMNMSLGHTSPTDAERELINASMQKSVEQGCTLMAASGNENNNVSTSCPANNSWTISVGSLTEKEDGSYERSWFSNYGERLDFVAPGDQITSAWADGSEVTISGTSMATPHMAAAAAMIKLKHPTYDQWNIYKTLQDYEVDLGEDGKDELYGNGYVNLKDFASEKEASVSEPKYQAISSLAVIKKTMNSVGKSDSLKAVVTKGDGTLTYTSSNPNVVTVSKQGAITVKGTGKCTVTITVSKTAKYKETKRNVQIEIGKGTQEIVIPTMKYTKTLGDKGFYVKASVKAPGDGTISFLANENEVVNVTSKGYVTIKGVGTAQIYAIASGTASFRQQFSNPITITVQKSVPVKKPAQAKITKVSPGKTIISVTWKKQSLVTGYQVRYAKNSTMKNATTKTIARSSAASYKISKLKKKQTYYVKVRAYKKQNGKTVYGSWSKAVKTKTKA